MSRSGFKISKCEDIIAPTKTRASWIDSFAKSQSQSNTENMKSAVEIARNRSDNGESFVDRISAMMGNVRGVNRFSSVEQVVLDMQKRTGLSDYLKKVTSESEEVNKKLSTASTEPVIDNADSEYPEILSKFPIETQKNIINFIRNNVKTHFGNTSVQAVQYELSSVFNNKGLLPRDVEDSKLKQLIHSIISRERSIHGEHDSVVNELGRDVGISIDDDDDSNSNYFASMESNN